MQDWERDTADVLRWANGVMRGKMVPSLSPSEGATTARVVMIMQESLQILEKRAGVTKTVRTPESEK